MFKRSITIGTAAITLLLSTAALNESFYFINYFPFLKSSSLTVVHVVLYSFEMNLDLRLKFKLKKRRRSLPSALFRNLRFK